jgi:hypothetical protein
VSTDPPSNPKGGEDSSSEDVADFMPPPGLDPDGQLDWMQAQAHISMGRGFRRMGRNLAAIQDVIEPIVAAELRWAAVRQEVVDTKIPDRVPVLGGTRMVQLVLWIGVVFFLSLLFQKWGGDPVGLSREAREWWKGACVEAAPAAPVLPSVPTHTE